jgi:hypothetical protein
LQANSYGDFFSDQNFTRNLSREEFLDAYQILLHRDCSVEDCSAKDDWDASNDLVVTVE